MVRFNLKNKNMNDLVKKEFSKGDFISPEELEREFGHKFDSLQLMALCQQVQNNHESITVKAENGGIRFLTDNEATGYNHDWFKRHLRGLAYRNKRMLAVDQSQLTKDHKKEHGRRLELQGGLLASIENSLTELLPPVPYERSIKKLI